MPVTEPSPSERVSRLRERIVQAPREACVERARYLTRSMSANWEAHPLTRMSAALAHILDEISVTIRPDELIVGCRTSKLKGAPFFPENKSRWIEGDIDTFEDRVIQKLRIADAEARELREDILPFWRGRTVEERFEELLPADVAEDMDKYVFTMILEITYGIGHFTMNHRGILERGLSRIIAEARQRLDAMTAGERDGDAGLFHQAVIRSLTAAIRFANRHAAMADSMAARETDPRRAAELEEIA
jgi:formate C-acetyltransferase